MYKSDMRDVLKQMICDKNEKILWLILDVINKCKNYNGIVNYLYVKNLDGIIKKLKVKNKMPLYCELCVDMKDEWGFDRRYDWYREWWIYNE